MTRDPYHDRRDARRYVERRQGRLSRRLEERRVRRAARGAARIVDVACGGGRFPEASVACDRSPGMLAIARARGLRCVRADAGALPFAGASFDAALCVRLVHHMDPPERRRVLAELARVAPVVVVTYFGTRGWKARRRAGRARRRTRRAIAPGELLADCRAAGLRLASDRAVLPLLGEQRVARLEREG